MMDDDDTSVELHQENNQRDEEALIEEQLFVHASESPGTQIVSVLLTETNFLIWKSAMTAALEVKFKTGFIVRPPEVSPKFLKWRRANSLVVSWIKSSMSPEIMNTFMFIHDVRKLWLSLEQRFGTTNLPQIFELKKGMMTLRQGNMSVFEYFGKLKQVWDQFDELRPIPEIEGAAGALLLKLQNEDRVMEFLMGLNDTYEGERSQIIYMDPLPNVDQTYSKIITAEKHRKVSTNIIAGDNMNSAMFVKNLGVKKENGNNQQVQGKKTDRSHLKCGHCQKTGHTKEECYKLKGYPSHLICTHCKKGGHPSHVCYKVKGYPEWWDHNRKGKEVNTVNQVQESSNYSQTPLDDESNNDLEKIDDIQYAEAAEHNN